MTKRLLIVHSDLTYAQELSYSFEADGYLLFTAKNIKEGLEKIHADKPHMVLLDMAFSDGTGLDFVKKIKEESDIPLIVVSEQGEDLQKVLAFEYGVDDYLVRPFNILELKARMRAIFRRVKSESQKERSELIPLSDFLVNPISHKVLLNNQDLMFTGKEFDIFYILASHEKLIFSRKDLAVDLWGEEYQGDLRTLDVHIRRMREKIEAVDNKTTYIQTKWGEGYYFQKI